MLRILTYILIAVALFHGLIHLMGFVAYWPLAKVSELPYKTTLLGERIEAGAGGMRLFSLLWLLAAIAFVAAAVALALGKPAWAPIMLAAVLLSLVICILDWGVAFRGALIDLAFLLILGVVFGLRVQPAPLAAYTASAAPVETIPQPTDLPKPVERFYRQTYGDQIPVYTSTVMTGHGTVRFMGITLPARMRFTHIAGQGYRHYIEATFYGLPVFKVNEHYLEGHTRLELPFGVVENDPGVDSAANQGLWAEATAYPAVFLTDPRVRWEAVDDTTARMYVPYADGEQVFTVQFDPQTGGMSYIETIRYRDEKVGKLRWWGDITAGSSQTGAPNQETFKVSWEDEGSPWLVYQVDDMVVNTDVTAYIQQTGP
jgi:hypothetical protein